MEAVISHKLAQSSVVEFTSPSAEKFETRTGMDFNPESIAGVPQWRDLPGMNASTDRGDFYRSVGKRAFDIALAVPLFLLFAPVIGVLFLIASRDGGRPWFSHQRTGRNGESFGCLKVRSMVVDAEARLAEVLERDPEAAAEWKESQKLTDDPRITRFGQFIRKTSLDELPQLLNVIRGDMSIVGPRPIVRDEVPRYGAAIRYYAQMRPGITGPWQVSGRNDLSYEERVALDVDYARKASLATDLRILAMTVISLLKRTGK